MTHPLPYESQSTPETFPADNGYTLLRTLAKAGIVFLILTSTIHFLLPLRDSFIRTQAEAIVSNEAPVCVGYSLPLKTHLKGTK